MSDTPPSVPGGPPGDSADPMGMVVPSETRTATGFHAGDTPAAVDSEAIRRRVAVRSPPGILDLFMPRTTKPTEGSVAPAVMDLAPPARLFGAPPPMKPTEGGVDDRPLREQKLEWARGLLQRGVALAHKRKAQRLMRTMMQRATKSAPG